ncbi:hypothetical protein MKX01_020076 [Papaver californicum]|nr:hypothetical protein MKX01_020076 [Papaver californicum]
MGMKWENNRLKNRYVVLSKQYNTMKSLLNLNDCTWDESTQAVMVTYEVWDTCINEGPCQRSTGLTIDTEEQLVLSKDESLSDSEEGYRIEPIGRNTQQFTKPSPLGNKKSRVPIEDVMVKAICRNCCKRRFSITNYVKALDEMQGIDDYLYYIALDMFDNPIYRETFIYLKMEKRVVWLKGKYKSVLS